MKYPVIFKTFSVLFSLQSDERWIVPIFGGTIILLLAFSAWRLCTEKKDKWRYRRMMLLSLILWGVGELLWQVNVSQIMIISSILALAFNLTAAVGAGMNPMEITSSTRKKSSGNGTGIVCIFEKYLW